MRALGLALLAASANAVAACGTEEMFEPRLATGERLIDNEAVAQLSKDDQDLEDLVVVGDLDGDGIDDAVLRTFNLGDFPDGAFDWHAYVYVVYGGSSVTGKIDYASLPSLTGVGSFGGGLSAVGDVDGDGLADFVIEAARTPGCGELPHASDHPYGGGYLVYGSNTRLTGATPIESASAFLRDPTPCTVVGPVSALGDLDGDGHADFAIGRSAPAGTASEIFVFYGRGARLSGTIDLMAIADAVISDPGTDHFRLSPVAQRIGDINGDGHDDFVLDHLRSPTTTDARLVLGSATRLTGRLTPAAVAGSVLAVDDRCVTAVRIATPLGDLDGDGLADFALRGCQDINGFVTAQHVFYGRAGGFPAQLAIDGADATITSQASNRILLSSADIDGDGKDDLIIGDEYRNDTNGAVQLVKSTGARLSGTVDPRTLGPSALGPTYVGRPRRGDNCDRVAASDCVIHDAVGADFTLGDLTGDHRVDLLIAAPGSQRASPAPGVHGSATGRLFLVSPPGARE